VHRSARVSFRVQELIRAAIQPVGEVGGTEGNENAARVKAKNDSGITRPVSKGKQNNAAYIIGRLKFSRPRASSRSRLGACVLRPLHQLHPWSH